jgi:hypothetical protein
MKSEENPTDESPIQRLVRSGDVRFAIDLSLTETGWRSKMTNARLATSNELLRTYGSDCWIQFHLSEAMLFQIQWSGRRIGVGNEMWQFFHRPLRFCHRVYRSALVKDVRKLSLRNVLLILLIYLALSGMRLVLHLTHALPKANAYNRHDSKAITS